MRLRFATAAALVALMVPNGVSARVADTGGTAQAGEVSNDDDIVVTARRRDESLSRVPVSVIAFGNEQLAERTVTGQSDLQFAAPGLLLRSTTNSSEFIYVIRGQSTDFASGSSPAVLPYTNEVQYSPGGGALYDLQSVQVLKGPQGTLFGRNTTGGAVLFATQKPGNEVEGFVTGRFGNLDQRQVTAAVTVPIADDKVLLRVAGDFSRRDGYVLNLYDGRKLGSENRKSGRATLVVKPGEGIENTTMFQYGRESGLSTPLTGYSAYAPGSLGPDGSPLTSATAATFNPGTLNFLFGPGGWDAFLAAHPGIPNLSYLDYLAFDRANGTRTVSVNEGQNFKGTDQLLTNTTVFEASDSLTIKNIFGYGKSRKHEENDYDGTPFPVLTSSTLPNPATGKVGVNEIKEHYSNELQASGQFSDGGVKYVAGLYFSKDTLQIDNNSGAFDLAPFVPQGSSSQASKYSEKNYAVYAQASFDLGVLANVPGLTLTAGGRYAKQKASIVQQQGGSFFILFGPSPQSVSYDKPSWTISLEYQANPDLLLYVANRGSWRTGGFNCCAPPLNVPGAAGGNILLPETTVDIEAGAKFRGSLGGMPASINLAVYNQWVKKAQKNVVAFFPAIGGVASLTINVPKVRVTGLEFDANIRPASWLSIGGTAVYTDAKFTDAGVNFLGNNYVFGPYADTPELAATGYVQIDVPAGSAGNLVLRGDLYHQTSFVFSQLANSVIPDTKLPGYTIVNGRVGLENVGGTKLSLALFGKNIFNKSYYRGGIPQGLSIGSNAAIVGEPRLYGLEATIKF